VLSLRVLGILWSWNSVSPWDWDGTDESQAAAKELANVLPATHRVLLVEPHSHFHHLFAFVSVTTVDPARTCRSSDIELAVVNRLPSDR
jgi:hypothetical protein